MVNNLKQLRERHCISIIRLIKQDALKKKEIFCQLTIKTKLIFIYKYRNRKFLLESALK